MKSEGTVSHYALKLLAMHAKDDLRVGTTPMQPPLPCVQ